MTPQKKENKLTKEKESTTSRALKIRNIFIDRYEQKMETKPELRQKHYILLSKFSKYKLAEIMIDWWFDKGGEWADYSVGGLCCATSLDQFKIFYGKQIRREKEKIMNELIELRQYEQTDGVKSDISILEQKLEELAA